MAACNLQVCIMMDTQRLFSYDSMFIYLLVDCRQRACFIGTVHQEIGMVERFCAINSWMRVIDQKFVIGHAMPHEIEVKFHVNLLTMKHS